MKNENRLVRIDLQNGAVFYGSLAMIKNTKLSDIDWVNEMLETGIKFLNETPDAVDVTLRNRRNGRTAVASWFGKK